MHNCWRIGPYQCLCKIHTGKSEGAGCYRHIDITVSVGPCSNWHIQTSRLNLAARLSCTPVPLFTPPSLWIKTCFTNNLIIVCDLLHSCRTFLKLVPTQDCSWQPFPSIIHKESNACEIWPKNLCLWTNPIWHCLVLHPHDPLTKSLLCS